jgi:hypothetical protein
LTYENNNSILENMDFVNEEKELELIKNPCLAILSEDQNK